MTIITAPADKVTPAEFARGVFGPTEADLAAHLASLSDEELEAKYQRALTHVSCDLKLLFGEKFRRSMESVNEQPKRRAA